jgi:hypothetical protein
VVLCLAFLAKALILALAILLLQKTAYELFEESPYWPIATQCLSWDRIVKLNTNTRRGSDESLFFFFQGRFGSA